MYVKDFTKYVEGLDPTQVPANAITYPSQNCLIYKGKIYNRSGIESDGVAATAENPIIGEKVWKDQLGGERALRANGTQIQLKYNNLWIQIFNGISATAARVRFDTWLNTTTPIIKKYLYFVDGTDKLFEWNGAVAVVASVAGADLTIAGTKTLQQLGFDTGAVTPRTVLIVRFSGGAVAGIEEYSYTEAATDGVLTLGSIPSPAPVAGDLIIAKPITYTTVLAGVLKDDVYTYKNQLGLANLTSHQVYFANAENATDYTIPGTPTVLSPYYVYLDGNYTAMISRKDVLWISTADDWLKITKSIEVLPDGTWSVKEKFEQPERNGALPFAVAKFKTDIIYMSQDKRLQRITTLEITGKDDTMLLSDDVENMLLRLDLEEMRIYYESRYIFIALPRESQLLMLDMVGNADLGVGMAWMPPQVVPISHLSIIDGVRYGHSNAENETYEMFAGNDDLGTDITVIIAFGYLGSTDRHKQNQHTRFGLNGRINGGTIVSVKHYFETDGAKKIGESLINGGTIKTFDISEDVSLAIVPWATKSWAAADAADISLRRFFVFDVTDAVSWFEYRPVFSFSGKENDFQLLGWSIDNVESRNKLDSALFIAK